MNIDYYDDVMAILMDVNLLKRLVDAGIPKDELFIPLADYLSINCIAAGQKENVEEEIVVAIIQRIKNNLDAWRRGDEGYENQSGQYKLN